jgi:hypothetical protein
MRALAAVTVVCLGAGMAVATGCGGSNDDHDKSVASVAVQEALAQERQRQEDAAQKAKLKQLQQKLHDERGKSDAQKAAGAAAGGSSGSSGSQGGGSQGGSSGGTHSCGSGVTAAASTTCSFALNVADTYRQSGGSSTIEVYSPVTKRTYTMNCTGSSTTTCTGGNNASVTFS